MWPRFEVHTKSFLGFSGARVGDRVRLQKVWLLYSLVTNSHEKSQKKTTLPKYTFFLKSLISSFLPWKNEAWYELSLQLCNKSYRRERQVLRHLAKCLQFCCMDVSSQITPRWVGAQEEPYDWISVPSQPAQLDFPSPQNPPACSLALPIFYSPISMDIKILTPNLLQKVGVDTAGARKGRGLKWPQGNTIVFFSCLRVWAEALCLVLHLEVIADVFVFYSSCKKWPHTYRLRKTHMYYVAVL